MIVEGRHVGIATAISASRRSAVRHALLASTGSRLVLAQAEQGAYIELGISPSAVPSDLPPGRGFLVRGRHPTMLVQVARSPVAGVDRAVDRNSGRSQRGSVDPSLLSAPLPTRLGRTRIDAVVGGVVSPSGGDRSQRGAPDRPADGSPAAVRSAVHAPAGVVVGVGIADVTGAVVAVDLAADDVAVLGPRGSGRSSTLASIAEGLIVGAPIVGGSGARGADRCALGVGSGAPVELWAIGRAGGPLTATLLGRWRDAVDPARVGLGSDAVIIECLDRLGRRLADRPDHISSGVGGSWVPPVLLVDDLDRLGALDDHRAGGALAALASADVRLVAATGARPGYATNPLAASVQRAGTVVRLTPGLGAPGGLAIEGAATLRPGVSMPPGRAIVTSAGTAVLCQLALPSTDLTETRVTGVPESSVDCDVTG